MAFVHGRLQRRALDEDGKLTRIVCWLEFECRAEHVLDQ